MLPWQSGELKNWSIHYMRHIPSKGSKVFLCVSLINAQGEVVTCRGEDDARLWLRLGEKAREIDLKGCPVDRQYTVSAGESLMGIAQRQLADAERWEELFNLNSELDIEPSPSGYLRPGMILRLPAGQPGEPGGDEVGVAGRYYSDDSEGDHGPWIASEDGVSIASDDFTHDVVLKVSGDFADDAQRKDYSEKLAEKLNRPMNV